MSQDQKHTAGPLKIAGEVQMKALSHELGQLRYERDSLLARNKELVEALELIVESDAFNGGTFIKELQRIARAALAKAKAL